MSVSSGYVHISVRNAQNRAAAAQRQGFNRPQYGAPQANPAQQYRVLRAVPGQFDGDAANPPTAPTPVITPNGEPGPQAVSADNVARGFVLYVGLDESAAAAAGPFVTPDEAAATCSRADALIDGSEKPAPAAPLLLVTAIARKRPAWINGIATGMDGI